MQGDSGKKPARTRKMQCIYTGYRRVNIKVVENSVEKVEKSAEIKKGWWKILLISSTGKEDPKIYVNFCRYPELNVVWSAARCPVKTRLWKTEGAAGKAGFAFTPAARARRQKEQASLRQRR